MVSSGEASLGAKFGVFNGATNKNQAMVPQVGLSKGYQWSNRLLLSSGALLGANKWA